MKLTIRAENVCGSTSDFVLLGQEPVKVDKHGPYQDDVPADDKVLIDLTVDFHTVVTIAATAIGAGETFCKEVELDYDVTSLQWTVPPANRHRFLLHELRWGDHNLIKQPGRI